MVFLCFAGLLALCAPFPHMCLLMSCVMIATLWFIMVRFHFCKRAMGLSMLLFLWIFV
jgi:hypothetical protein